MSKLEIERPNKFHYSVEIPIRFMDVRNAAVNGANVSHMVFDMYFSLANEAEEKNLEFANINKEMLKQLEEIFESEEKIREKLESKRKIKDQNSLQEKSIKIALKELQEELLMGRVNNYVSKGPEILKNSISKRNKTKLQD